jgi:probable F420-dependent oxidoreductase
MTTQPASDQPLPAPGRFRVGFQLQPQHADYAVIRRAATEAEEIGVDIVFNWDHFYPLSGDPVGKHFECWTMLGAWAEATERVEIGALVTCNSYRNPDLLADMARTVDHISAGRLILGIGSGWFQHDYDEYGYEFGTAGGRLDSLGESLPRIKARLAALNPPPTRDIPVLIGGGGEKKTLRLVAQYAQACNLFASPDLEHKLDVLRRHCETLGRDYDEIEKTVMLPMDPGEHGENVDSLLSQLEHLAGLGISEAHGRVPRASEITPLELFGERVIPVAATF